MANTGKDLTAANIRYLLALRDLDGDQRGVRCVSIAEALGVSKPSVHAMMDTLKKLSLVDKDRYGTVRFTPAGRELADRYAIISAPCCPVPQTRDPPPMR